MIEVPQALLILCKKDDVPGMAIGNTALGPQMHHGRIDGLEAVDIMLLFQFLHELVHDQAAGHGIIRRTVVIEVRQAQGIGYHIQLEFI